MLLSKQQSKNMADLNKEFIVTTDGSQTAIGGYISQINDNNKEIILDYFSQKLSKAEQKYAITDIELLAAVKTIRYYRHLLLGKKFTLKTDHMAIKYLKDKKNTNNRLMRYALELQEYKFDIHYIQGKTNAADFLSRCYHIKSYTNKDIKNSQEKDRILEDYHVYSGHGNYRTMFFLCRCKYKWTGMNKDIKNYLAKCETCLYSNIKYQNTQNNIIKTNRPNEMWQTDLIGPLTDEENKNYYIFVAIDHFTKWAETALLKGKQADKIATCVEKLIIEKHGIPKTIYSDNGHEFKNLSTDTLCKKYGFIWNYKSPNYHKSTGCVERANQSIFNKLKKSSEFGKKNWKLYLSKATYG